MKTTICLCFAFSSLLAFSGEPTTGIELKPTGHSEETLSYRLAQNAKKLEQARLSFVPADPYRLLHEKTNFAKGLPWHQFCGKVLAVGNDTVFVEGWYGDALGFTPEKWRFAITNYPHPVTVGGQLKMQQKLTAYDTQKQVMFYTKEDGGRACKLFDYGKVVVLTGAPTNLKVTTR